MRLLPIFASYLSNILKGTLLIMVLLCTTVAKSQENEVGAWIGGANYFGDLNPKYSFKELRWAGGILYRYNINTRMAVRANVNYGRVEATDAKNDQPYPNARNLHFRSDILELAALFEMNFFKYILGNRKHMFTPYLFAGASMFYYNPITNFNDQKIKLQEVGTEGQYIFEGPEDNRYNTYSFAIPFGGGIKYGINENWSINVEFSSRRTFTDYIDDVSDVYQDPALLNATAQALADRSENNIGSIGKQRGTSKDVDRFNFYGIAITYTFHTVKCPKTSILGLDYAHGR